MNQPGPFCAELRGVVCPICPLAVLGEATIAAAVEPGVTPFAFADAVGSEVCAVDAEFIRAMAAAPPDEEPSDVLVSTLDTLLARLRVELGPVRPLDASPKAEVAAALGRCVEQQVDGLCIREDEPQPDAANTGLGAVVGVDRKLGAAFLQELARHGTVADVRERLRGVVGVLVYALKELGVRVSPVNVDTLAESEVRDRLMTIAAKLEAGELDIGPRRYGEHD